MSLKNRHLPSDYFRASKESGIKSLLQINNVGEVESLKLTLSGLNRFALTSFGVLELAMGAPAIGSVDLFSVNVNNNELVSEQLIETFDGLQNFCFSDDETQFAYVAYDHEHSTNMKKLWVVGLYDLVNRAHFKVTKSISWLSHIQSVKDQLVILSCGTPIDFGA
jgi:hypothetical protein